VAFARLGALPWISDFYLAGSAALSLYLQHRPVHGLDLMSPVHRLEAIERRDLLEALLASDATTRIETARDGFLYARLQSDVAVRFYYYPYPLIDPEVLCGGIPVASLIDLGLMKLAAIISRGTRRDFVDLHLLCKQLPLAHLLDRAQDKFGHVDDFALQALKGLADQSLTEGEPMPRLADPLDWREVQIWIEDEVRCSASERMGRD
jgi:hypothetical protein